MFVLEKVKVCENRYIFLYIIKYNMFWEKYIFKKFGSLEVECYRIGL